MSEIDKRNASRIAAVKTLERLGYTYEGGAEWKPPLGKTRDALEELTRGVAELRKSVLSLGPGFALAEVHIGCSCPMDLDFIIWSSPSFVQQMRQTVPSDHVREFKIMGAKVRGVAA